MHPRDTLDSMAATVSGLGEVSSANAILGLGMHYASREARSDLDGTHVPRRVSRIRAVAFGMLAASALTAAWVIALKAPTLSRPETVSDPGYSPAYLFGFAHAALAGCNVEPGSRFPGLETQVTARADGAVPEDVGRGFAAFAEIAGSKGADSACRQAEFLFGAGSKINPNVLIPRR